MFCEVNLLGRVSKEPEIIEAIKATKAVKFSVAYNSTQKKPDNSGYESCFVNCVAFAFNADKALEKLKKGSMVNIRGNLQITSRQDNMGAWVNYTSVCVDKMVCFAQSNTQSTAGAYQTQKNFKSNPYDSTHGRALNDKYDYDYEGEVPF